MSLRSLPKTELHLHLDCSLDYEVAAALSHGLTQEQFERDFVAPARCASLAEFLTRAPAGYRLMQSTEALRLVTGNVFRQLAADNIRYAEIRYAPLLHTEKGLSAEAVVEAVDRATEDAIRATGIEARLILCTLRHYSEAQSMQTVQLVERFKGSRVAALDLAGDEAGYSIAAHVAAFRYASEHGLARTAHAGEACGPCSVQETLQKLEPARLGHGVRSIEDPLLIEKLAASSIHLEICPSSNVQIGIVDSYAAHPVDRLYRAGVSVGINTDNRTITNVTLTEEYERLAQNFGWGKEQFLRCNLNAIEAAFVEDAVKARLRPEFIEAYGV